VHVSLVRASSLRSIDKVEITFRPGLNALVGPNNSGKSSFLRAFETGGFSEPHRSSNTVPRPGADFSSPSECELHFTFSAEEYREVVGLYGAIAIPQPSGPGGDNRAVEVFLRTLASHEPKTIVATSGNNGLLVSQRSFTFGKYQNKENSYVTIYQHARQWTRKSKGVSGDDVHKLHVLFRREIESRTQLVGARIVPQSSWQSSGKESLHRDGSNLVGVLQQLNANPLRWSRFTDLVSYVFPSVRAMALAPSKVGPFIKIWFHDAETERDDLAIPLDQCGTGLSQGIAILAALQVDTMIQLLVMDEPQSHLHPGALRKILRLIDRSDVQVVVATHSPLVLSAASLASVTAFSLNNGVTAVKTVDWSIASEVRQTLHSIGVRPVDLFGAQTVLWVEGPTESDCFSYLITEHEDLVEKSLELGVEVLPLVNTGPFDARRSQKVLQHLLRVYQVASGATAVLPPAVAFVLDKECRTLAQREDLKRRADARIEFLPRRMFENYLLQPTAVCAVIAAELPDDADRVPSVDSLRVSLEIDDPVSCDGAAILRQAFAEFSLEYRKRHHGLLLVQQLMSTDPTQLAELVEFLSGLLVVA